jgi:hypothetical protein
MNAQISYESTKGNCKLQVIKATEFVTNTYTAKLTNLTTGATQECGGWRNRPDAIASVQRMYETQCA